MNIWKELVYSVSRGRAYDDHKEILNKVVVINSFEGVKEPLRWLRTNGNFIYPSDEEIKDSLFSQFRDEYDYTLGARLHNFDGLNQLQRVIDLLKQDPSSRKAIITFVDPKDIKKKNLVSFLNAWFRIIDGSLNMSMNLRSIDVVLGFPANYYQAYLLFEHVASALGLKVGNMTLFINSAHYYDEDLVVKLLK